MNPNDLTPEEKQRIIEDNKKVIPMQFTKGELIIIFNVLTRVDMRYGDALQIIPLVQKIEPYVAVASNIPDTNHKTSPLVTGKKEKN